MKKEEKKSFWEKWEIPILVILFFVALEQESIIGLISCGICFTHAYANSIEKKLLNIERKIDSLRK